MANLPKGAKVFNVVRADMNSVYLNDLPSATSDNINTTRYIYDCYYSIYKYILRLTLLSICT